MKHVKHRFLIQCVMQLADNQIGYESNYVGAVVRKNR